MSVVEIKIKLPESGRDAYLGKVRKRLADLSGLMKIIGGAELEVTRERFSTKTAPDGSKWAPNAPLTLLLAKGGSMMQRSGALKGSINFTVAGTKLSIGANRVYARIQQLGGIVKAKDGKALRIPIPAGTVMSAGQAQALGVEQKKTRKPGDAASTTAGAIFVKSVTIPARPYIGIGEADRDAIQDAVEEWFDIA